jgi:hypothetical protein
MDWFLDESFLAGRPYKIPSGSRARLDLRARKTPPPPTHSLIGGSKFPVTKSEGKYSKPLNSPAFRRDQTEAKGSKMLQNGGFPCKFPVSAP